MWIGFAYGNGLIARSSYQESSLHGLTSFLCSTLKSSHASSYVLRNGLVSSSRPHEVKVSNAASASVSAPTFTMTTQTSVEQLKTQSSDTLELENNVDTEGLSEDLENSVRPEADQELDSQSETDGNAPTSRRSRQARLLVDELTYVKLTLEARKFGASGSVIGDAIVLAYLDRMEESLYGRSMGPSPPESVPNCGQDVVILDVEGVVYDSSGLCAAACSETMRRLYKVKVSPETLVQYTSRGDPGLLMSAAREVNIENFELSVAIREYMNVYLRVYSKQIFALRGVKELIRRLRSQGTHVCLLGLTEKMKLERNLFSLGFIDLKTKQESEETRGSSSLAGDIGSENSNAEIHESTTNSSHSEGENDSKTGFECTVDSILSLDLVKGKKPAPNVFKAAASELGTDNVRVSVICAIPAAVKSAKSAGMRVAAVSTLCSREELLSSGADAVQTEPDSLRFHDIFTSDHGSLKSEQLESKSEEQKTKTNLKEQTLTAPN
uniref:Uncharacterized protein n=1 Tax=Timspurckia oligopyrenoides TaxID=708627 RepID=A0A6T6LUM8_9RHOD|mmetsp:Transcript_13397/g.24039  ORF Transcript_13397/g.24039 Transcript_13397/m.24039 type:complete len:496 (+) Transcript_13397:59-1546(+)